MVVPELPDAPVTRSSLAQGVRVGSVVLILVGLAAVLAGTGVLGHLTDQERLRSTVDAAGVWGPVVFVGLMVVLVPLNVPGLVFVIPSTTLFGTAGGVLLSLTGGFIASVIGIVAARRFGRAAFERRMPARLRRIEARVSARGFPAVVLLRVFTFLFQPADWLCGLSSIPMRTVLAGTFIGLIPPTLVIALTGGGILDLVL